MELLEHYSNIHNYINENYCHLKYNVEYYTEDFKETLAKAWTATKNFIVKIWNMIVNWFKGLFNPVVKNWAKLFNQAQSNWSKLKKKIEKEEFTDKDTFINALKVSTEKVANDKIKITIDEAKKNWLLRELFGIRKVDKVEDYLSKIKGLFKDNLKNILNERNISDNKGNGKYTLLERIDGFLSKNSYYIDLIKDDIKLVYTIKGFMSIIKDDNVDEEILKKLENQGPVNALITAYGEALTHKEGGVIFNLKCNKWWKFDKELIFSWSEDLQTVCIVSKNKKNLSDNTNALTESIRNNINYIKFMIFDVIEELFWNKNTRNLYNEHIDKAIENFKEQTLETAELPSMNQLTNNDNSEALTKIGNTSVILQKFIEIIYKLINSINECIKYIIDSILNFFKFLKENA